MSISYIKDNVDYQKVIESFKLKIKQFETAAEKNQFYYHKVPQTLKVSMKIFIHMHLFDIWYLLCKQHLIHIIWALASIRCKALNIETKN